MNIDLNRRILILVLIPSLIMGSFFVFWFSSQQIKEIYRDLNVQIDVSASRLGMAMEFGLLTNNSLLIHQLAKEALNEDNVRSITVVNGAQEVLSQVGPDLQIILPEEMVLVDTIYRTNTTYAIVHPIEGKHTSLYGLNNKFEEDNIGWLILELSTSRAQVLQYRIILINLSILISAILLSIILALSITRTITSPLTHILDIVSKIKNGDFNARIEPVKSKEMSELADGINMLANSLEQAYTDMQKNIDQATTDLRETLETLEIQNIELDMARREAIDASRIKSEFLSNMSHEIRTPLNGIIGFIRLLMKSNLTHKQEDYSKTILSSSESLLSIINDVLDFAKIEAGKLALDKMTVDLKHSVEDVLVMLAPTAHARQIELVPLYFSDVPKLIMGDPLRIKQVITNLVNNAIKFTEKGQVLVRVSVETDFGNAMNIRISVSDTGIGLTDDQQKALFQSFQQANTSTARQYGGTGLGLIISKKIVEQMGGDIGIESEYGVGSTFWFTLRAEIPSEVVMPALPAELANKTAIVYDTNPAMQSSVRHALESWNIIVKEAKSLESLIDMTKTKPDIAIIGFGQSNQVSGDLHHKISDMVKHKGIFTLVLNNAHEDNINMKLIEQKASAYMSKPFHSSKLAQVLLDRSQTDPEKIISPDCKILAVDDNLSNLKLIQTLLEDLGIETTTASSGAMALNILEDQVFDLIFMDIQMPQLDGLETTQMIRSKINHPRARIPVVALTAHAMANERDHLLKSGMDDYLTKPIDEQMLIQTIYKWTGIESRSSISNYKVETLIQVDKLSTIDISLALKRANGKPNLAFDMFNSLIEQLESDRSRLSDLLISKNYKELLERVHKIHGACHYCGVPNLKQNAKSFEILLKQEQVAKYQSSLENINNAIDDIIDWSKNHDFKTALVNFNQKSDITGSEKTS